MDVLSPAMTIKSSYFNDQLNDKEREGGMYVHIVHHNERELLFNGADEFTLLEQWDEKKNREG